MKIVLSRFIIAPFETAFFFILAAFGVSGLMNVGPTDPINVVLPSWEAHTLLIVSLVAGILGLYGILTAKGRWEILGLYLLCGVILSRLILYGHYLGYGRDFFNTGIFDAALLVASIARASTIRKHKIIVRIRKTDDHDFSVLD